jgi:regulatory protein
MLGRRAMAAAALRERLRRSFDDEHVEQAVKRLVELRVLDDAVYAESFVRDRFERRGYGRERIRAELAARGCERDAAAQAIARVIDERREREVAARALGRFRRLNSRRKTPQQERAAAFRHLIGRGFALDLVRDLLGGSL